MRSLSSSLPSSTSATDSSFSCQHPHFRPIRYCWSFFSTCLHCFLLLRDLTKSLNLTSINFDRYHMTIRHELLQMQGVLLKSFFIFAMRHEMNDFFEFIISLPGTSDSFETHSALHLLYTAMQFLFSELFLSFFVKQVGVLRVSLAQEYPFFIRFCPPVFFATFTSGNLLGR